MFLLCNEPSTSTHPKTSISRRSLTLPFFNPPGISFPEGEQKQFGNLQVCGSHGLALFGSLTESQRFSSDPSAQSFVPSQNLLFAMQTPSAHENILSELFFPPHLFSSKSGTAIWFRSLMSQFVTSAAH